jgi:MFS family permease
MLVSPVSQAIVARLAPEAMRGRYMAVFGFSWLIPIAIGPLLAGLVMDYWDPDWVWYLAGLIGLVAAGAYYGLQWRVDRARDQAIIERLTIMEQLEEGEITAQEASRSLEKVNEGVWARLANPPKAIQTRHLRIQVTDQSSGTMKSDLRIPVGLAYTVLHSSGSLSTELDGYNQDDLKSMIAFSTSNQSSQRMESGDDQIDMSIE